MRGRVGSHIVDVKFVRNPGNTGEEGNGREITLSWGGALNRADLWSLSTTQEKRETEGRIILATLMEQCFK